MDEEREDLLSGPLAEVVRDPVGMLRRRWKPMLAVAAAILVATGAFVVLQTPLYAAHATILIASQKLSEEFVRPTMEEDVLERVNALTAEALSRDKLTPLVEKYDLFPAVREEYGMVAAVGALRSGLSIESEKPTVQSRGARALVLLITYTGTDPKITADITNDVARLFTDAGVRLRTQQARLTTDFMRRELESAEEALKVQTKEISEFQQAHRGELPSELESNLRRLERLQQQRNSLAMQITQSETQMAIAAANAAGPDPARVRLQELQTQLARELGVNKETHPNVMSLRRQIAVAQGQVGGAYGTDGAAAGAGQREVALLREQLADTDRELKEIDAAVAAIPARQEQLAGMLERQSVLQENYLDFLRKVKEAELAQSLEMAQQGDRVAVLDSAFPPSEPENAPWKYLILGIAASLGLSLALGVLLELRDPVLVSPSALEAATGVPVLGTVPHMT